MRTVMTTDIFELNAEEIDCVSGAKVSDDTIFTVGSGLIATGVLTSEFGVGLGFVIVGGLMVGWAMGGS